MFKLKIINKPKMIKMKCNIEFPDVVLANFQEKEAIPTKEQQEIVPDKNFDGLSKVIVDKIPDEYIIPSGNLEISQNGTFNVTDKVNAIVNVPEKKLGTKTITTNGTYKATDDSLDGYSQVEVATSGVDINDYFNNSLERGYGHNIGSWCDLIKKLPPINFNGTTCNSMFQGYMGVELDLGNFNTSNVTDMGYMFSSCSSLTSLDLSSFNTSNVTDMYGIFFDCSSLTSLDLSNFDTPKITSLNACFQQCSSLTNLDLSNFNISKVTSMNNTFRDCKKITNLDLSSFGETNVTSMTFTFYGCTSLETLNLSNLTNLQTVNVSQTFYNCYKLNNINMSSFDFTKTTNYTNMFQNVPKDCYILVKDETQKNWFTTHQSRMTNVHYVGEEVGR